jgi:hypothetical protein
MNETMTLEVTTHLYGLGSERHTPPVYVMLSERTLPVREVIAEHVRAEVDRAQQYRMSSLALHYMLADDLRANPAPVAAPPTFDAEAEIRRAWAGLATGRYLLVVDGASVTDLDATLALTERSRVSFVRLLPLIGG